MSEATSHEADKVRNLLADPPSLIVNLFPELLRSYRTSFQQLAASKAKTKAHREAAKQLCELSRDLRLDTGRIPAVEMAIWSWMAELFKATARCIHVTDEKTRWYAEGLSGRAEELLQEAEKRPAPTYASP